MARSGVPVSKKRRLNTQANKDSSGELFSISAEDPAQDVTSDVEQEYERRLDKHGKDSRVGKGLLVKSDESPWTQNARRVGKTEDSDSADDSASEVFVQDEVVAGIALDRPNLSAREQILEAKEELARLASLINEDPEEHIGALRSLSKLSKSSNPTVVSLALAAQVAVYKDIIPGYRIRPHKDEDPSVKLSKSIRRLRSFEETLVKGYRELIDELAVLARRRDSEGEDGMASVTSVAISCACSLLLAVPHFNFRKELLEILVGKMSVRKADDDTIRCVETMEQLFRDDEDGYASLEAVTMMAKMMKSRSYNVNERVLNSFLHLRLLAEYSYKASNTKVDKTGSETQKVKPAPYKKEFRTKKQRKTLREQKKFDEEMKMADATVSHEESERMQSETLKMVFVIYFRILKARTPALMGAVLEGLARYAHLINQDFFGDIIEALRDIIGFEVATEPEDEMTLAAEQTVPPDVTRKSLLCCITAFALLQSQDISKAANSLRLDLTFFITHLYQTLLPASLDTDIELSAKSLRLRDPSDPDSQSTAANKVNVQTTSALLLRSLSSAILPSNVPARAVPPIRVAAFARQLMIASLHLPDRSSRAMLALTRQVAKAHGSRIGALWYVEERRGDGEWNPLCQDPEKSNPFSGTVWEGELLRRHYCPEVRESLEAVEREIQDSR